MPQDGTLEILRAQELAAFRAYMADFRDQALRAGWYAARAELVEARRMMFLTEWQSLQRVRFSDAVARRRFGRASVSVETPKEL